MRSTDSHYRPTAQLDHGPAAIDAGRVVRYVEADQPKPRAKNDVALVAGDDTIGARKARSCLTALQRGCSRSFDDVGLRGLDEADDAHRCAASGTGKGIDLVDAFDEGRPASAGLPGPGCGPLCGLLVDVDRRVVARVALGAHASRLARVGLGRFPILAAAGASLLLSGSPACAAGARGLWVDGSRLASLPTSGEPWENLLRAAGRPTSSPDLSDRSDAANVHVLAKALVYGRTGDERYRREVVAACMAAMGTEGNSTLALGRELAAYVFAADLVGLPEDVDCSFRDWLRRVRHRELRGRTLISTHEKRANNWGTHAGASRLAVAAYLDDTQEIERAAAVFRGWLGDRSAYDGFKYHELWWQARPAAPVGVNPRGATRQGRSIDGVLPDDQRRGGPFTWPPPKENYVYGALQGALVQAVILHNAGYDVWNWGDRALLRAFQWLHEQANFAAEGDDTWQPHVVNYFYGTRFPAPVPTQPGKNVGWTDWTHGAPSRAPASTAAAAWPAPTDALPRTRR